MLAIDVAVESADFLPLHDREDRIQGVEVRDLDIGRVDVLGARRLRRRCADVHDPASPACWRSPKIPPSDPSSSSRPMPTSTNAAPIASSFSTISRFASPASKDRNAKVMPSRRWGLSAQSATSCATMFRCIPAVESPQTVDLLRRPAVPPGSRRPGRNALWVRNGRCRRAGFPAGVLATKSRM